MCPPRLHFFARSVRFHQIPRPFALIMFPSLHVVPWEEKDAKRGFLRPAHGCFGSRVDAPSPGFSYEIGW